MKNCKQRVAQEVLVQEQRVKKMCPHCKKICRAIVTEKLIPKYCYHCGTKMNYFSSK